MKLRFSKVHFIGQYISAKAWLRSAKPSAFTASQAHRRASARNARWRPFALVTSGLAVKKRGSSLPLALGKPALLAEENVRGDP